MGSVQPRSPSPTPPAPVPTRIEPGPRAAALCKVYNSALTSTLKANSYDAFSSCFPTPAKYCPTALQGVWKQLNTRLDEECQKDFDKILEEREAISKLNAWDEVLEDARVRRSRSVIQDNSAQPLHLLSAHELNAAFMVGYLKTTTTELETKLYEVQQSNKDIADQIRSQREEMERMVSGLEATVQDIETAVKRLEEEDMDHMKAEVWTLDVDIRNTS